jgi:hypothetical protein
MSPDAPEARDCFQVGPGLPPKWPYRLTPETTGTFKLDEQPRIFKRGFSIAGGAAIAHIALTSSLAVPEIEALPWLGSPAKGCYRVKAPTSGRLTAFFHDMEDDDRGKAVRNLSFGSKGPQWA